MSEETLTSFVESVCGQSHLRVEDDLGDGFVRLRSAEAERRQAAHDIRSTEDIVIEMLRNARDASARNIFLAVSREEKVRKLCMIDDGCGIPSSMHERIFEPRVTSKLDSMHFDKWGVHGRGMALYSIKVNAEKAYVAASSPKMGSALAVEVNLDRLSEKTDQSTFPTLEMKEPGSLALRGPKNIVRTVCEFSLESRNACTVYLGSPVEVAATLHAFGCSTLARSLRVFSPDEETVPLCKRLCLAHDPSSFVDAAEKLGLSLSERSARRILDGEIGPLDCMFDKLRGAPVASATTPKTGKRMLAKKSSRTDARGLKLAAEDIAEIKKKTCELYKEIAARYYLDEHVDPDVRVRGDAIRITIPVEKLR